MAAGGARTPALALLAARPARPRAREEAVSPVVGAVLVLAITVLGIVAVNNWGLPAIQEMKANVELRSVLNEFRDLEASIEKLVSGTAGQTSLKWQPALGLGSVDVNATGARWLAAIDVANSAVPWLQVVWSGVEDEDAEVTLTTNLTVGNFKIRAWRWTAGAAVELNVTSSAGACEAAAVGSRAAGTHTFHLKTNGTCEAVPLRNAVVSFQVSDLPSGGNETVLHRAFLVDAGFVHWTSVEGRRGPTHVYSSNGGILVGPSDGLSLQAFPAVPPPRELTNSTGVEGKSLFVRIVKLNGTASFSSVSGAATRFAVHLSLVGTYTLGSADNSTAAYLYVWGPLQRAVYDGFLRPGEGYDFAEATGPGGTTYLWDEEGGKPFPVTVVYSLIAVEG